jgi:beta-glucosidase
VTVAGDPRMWRCWDAAAACWSRLSGTGELLVARGLGDVRLRIPVGTSA